MHEVLFTDRNGRGHWEIWNQMLKPNANGSLVILGCPIRNITIRNAFTNQECFGMITHKQTLQSLVGWLMTQGYLEVVLVVSRMNIGTALNKAIESL